MVKLGALYPKFISVTNAIYICEKCSKIHKTFGDVSVVKSPNMDNWEENQIKLLSFGGNQRLKYLLLEYSVAQNTDPNYKYFLYCVDYYRRLLKWEAQGGEQSGGKQPVKPDALLGIESLRPDTNVNQNPTNNQVDQGQKQDQPPQQQDKGDKGFFSDLNKMANQTGEEINKAFTNINKKDNFNQHFNKMGTDTKNAFDSFGKDTETFFSKFADDTKKVFINLI